LLGLDEVAELRSLLRRADPVARQVAYGLLDSWSGDDLDELGARAVLEAAAGSYPHVHGDHRHAGESLARVLWEVPRLVPAEEVLRAFLVAGDRARRALLHLLALRRDNDGLEALESIFAPHGPRELLPTAMMPVLDPLLELGQRDRVVALLCTALLREGWTWHAAELLVKLQRAGRPRTGEQRKILRAAAVLVDDLVDACDRGYVAAVASHYGRRHRESLECVARLLDELTEVDRRAALHRMLASADPRVSAVGATRLLALGSPLAPERLELIARDPVARADLYDGVRRGGDLSALRTVVDQVGVHEAMLARWLSEVTELGRAPDEMELLGTRTGPSSPERTGSGAVLYLFRFRLRSPHWSSARGWMVGLAGPWIGSCYSPEEDHDLDGHVEEIRLSLTAWPGRREDGAA
jgi:hypothetical protein